MNVWELPSPSLRVLQLLVAALVLGVVIFAGVAMFVAPAGTTTANPAALRMALFATLGACVIASLVVRHRFLRGASGPSTEHERNPHARATDDDRTGQSRRAGNPCHPQPDGDATDLEVPPRFFTGTILGCALLEAVALFGVVLYLTTADPLDLVVAGIPLLLMAIGFFPTEARLRRFVW